MTARSFIDFKTGKEQSWKQNLIFSSSSKNQPHCFTSSRGKTMNDPFPYSLSSFLGQIKFFDQRSTSIQPYQRITLQYQLMQEEGNIPNQQKEEEESPKRSLCRFYVRGLCLYKKECHFSHGIDDLDYQPLQHNEVIQADYLKDVPFCQKKAIKGPRIYINLYEFQQNPKKYTLEQLNQERTLRVEVRNEMHRQLFHDFIELLQKKYPGANLTEDFLMREYTRVGFNKLMTRIKFSHLASFLCEGEGSKYFRKSMVMPPLVKQETTYIFRRASEEETLEVYRQEYQRILKEAEGPLDEAIIKKKLFQAPIPHVGIPPLTMVLKEKRLSFADFLQVLNGSTFTDMLDKIQLQAMPEQMVEAACSLLDKEGTTRLVNWGEVYQQLSKQFKVNNGNVLNQVKPLLVMQGYQFLSFPTVQFIYNRKFAYDFRTEMMSNCPCEFRKRFPEEDLKQLSGEGFALNEGESVDINSLQSLLKYGPLVLKSKILGVDLQGSLRRGGYVQMVQLNNQSNTFLFDIYAMGKQGEHEAITLTKKLLRNVMVDEEILKIFHDCRHDSLALHLFLETCITNVFDTSATETVFMQLQAYSELSSPPPLSEEEKIVKAKNAIQECNNVKTVGLNQILKRYQASHGINRHKDRFHKMWSQGEVDFFCKRPLDPDYREYCIKDVLDLPEIYHKIALQHPEEIITLCQWVASSYVRQGHQSTQQP